MVSCPDGEQPTKRRFGGSCPPSSSHRACARNSLLVSSSLMDLKKVFRSSPKPYWRWTLMTNEITTSLWDTRPDFRQMKSLRREGLSHKSLGKITRPHHLQRMGLRERSSLLSSQCSDSLVTLDWGQFPLISHAMNRRMSQLIHWCVRNSVWIIRLLWINEAELCLGC